jgi:hypothetical protein
MLESDGRRRIVFFVSSIDEYAAVETSFEQTLFDSQRSALEWLVSWVKHRPDTELVVRVHPRMRRLGVRERAWWNLLGSENVTVLAAESPVDSYLLAESADRVVSFHSSMAAEATYLGKVSILVGDAAFRGLDCVYEPKTMTELEQMLVDLSLPPKPRANCLPFGYWRLMRGESFRFYQPESFSQGTFSGVSTAPGDPSPVVRMVVRVLGKLGRAAYGYRYRADLRRIR